MVRSNEFTADSFAGAIRKATAAYDRSQLCEVKNQRRCNDLVLEMTGLSREAGRYADKAERLRREADSLQREAAEAFGFAAVAALSGFAVAFLRLGRVLRAIERLRKGTFSRADIIDSLGLIGPAAGAIAALSGVTKFEEARELSRDADKLIADVERVGQDYMLAFNEYDRLGCGEDRNFTGT